ncbi:MarR family winged helix-turn-helix transcriptional regulator [Actinoplanes couchii]|uniref:MarR family transcriptional regulator n=1 Tax=Actinoplanes couchii TaxID=403638 RepID=A0ABQ3X896_9ACTN|nr:MarR family transcriptional regulator [Actinoplanes couchii]MDR6320258.1 DNA-binding MarR family transcriptional regulator [Actinoplanes couchii]GID54727.1 MarR family transcriptional regulator [Actinoplanes couchii]
MGSSRRRALPTREQLHVWRGYVETAEVLRSRLGARLQSETSLSAGDYQVLLALSEASGGTMRSSTLAVTIGWERSRLSHHLGRMEKRDLIRRVPCDDDVHGIDVTLTATGAETFRAATVPHLRAVREMFADALTDEQLDQVEELTATLRRHLGLDPL